MLCMLGVTPILPCQAISPNEGLLQVLEGNRSVSIKVSHAFSGMMLQIP